MGIIMKNGVNYGSGKGSIVKNKIRYVGSDGITITPINIYLDITSSDVTETNTLNEGVYMLMGLNANSQTTSFSLSGTYNELYSRNTVNLIVKIVTVANGTVLTTTMNADPTYPSSSKYAGIFKIEGATGFEQYYAQASYDSYTTYDFSNLGSGTYIAIACGSSIYDNPSYNYTTYPFTPIDGVNSLATNLYYSKLGKAFRILVCESHNADIYAYGQYGGAGIIQIIKVI